jgi:serine/threonine-protein kinase HipA
MRFAYRSEWLARGDARPLSRTLPLRTKSFANRWARPFFAGILPEEEPKRRIAAIFGISEGNDFAMLERIGGECAGAVSLLPEGGEPPARRDVRVRRLGDRELAGLVAELPRRPLMAGEDGLRLSLAGAQNKLPVLIDAGGISLPLDDAPSSHILKPEAERFPGLVANEALCMNLARGCGLNVPDVETRVIGGIPCLVVERYDRVTAPDGVLRRLHQEDFCQALGFPPERKYQQEGGPLLRDCISLLREWSTTPVLDLREFIDIVVFNVLIGNADAHAKNFSILYRKESRRLAPFYDLVCTPVWPELSKRLSMRIGKARMLNEVTSDHLRQMTVEVQLGWPMMSERAGNLCRKVLGCLNQMRKQPEPGDSGMTDRVVRMISGRTERLLGTLG